MQTLLPSFFIVIVLSFPKPSNGLEVSEHMDDVLGNKIVRLPEKRGWTRMIDWKVGELPSGWDPTGLPLEEDGNIYKASEKACLGGIPPCFLLAKGGDQCVPSCTKCIDKDNEDFPNVPTKICHFFVFMTLPR